MSECFFLPLGCLFFFFFSSSTTQPTAPAAANPTETPWTRVRDAQSGRTFFYNPVTGDTRWTAPRPDSATVPPLAVDAEGRWCLPGTSPTTPSQLPQPAPPLPRALALPPPRTHALYLAVRATVPPRETVHAALWRGAQRLTAPAVLRADAPVALLGPLRTPPGRTAVLRLARHRTAPHALGAVALLPAPVSAVPGARARAPSVLAPTPPLPESQPQEPQKDEGKEQERMHEMELDAEVCPAAAVGTLCGGTAMWVEAALVAQAHVPRDALAPALALAPDELLAGRNDLNVAVDLAAFAQNAHSVEGFALPAAFDVCAHAVCRGRAAGVPCVVARHRPGTDDALAARASLAHIALDPALAADPALCVVLDFVALEKEEGDEDDENAKRVSFAWAYAKLAGVGERARSDVQVYCGAPVVVAVGDGDTLVPVVPALTPPDVLAQARARTDKSSLAGLAVTTVPLSIYLASAERCVHAALADPAVAAASQVLADALCSDSKDDLPESSTLPVPALVHVLREVAAATVQSCKDDEAAMARLVRARPLFERCIDELCVATSSEDFAHLAAGLHAALPANLAARLLDHALAARHPVIAAALALRLAEDDAAAVAHTLDALCSVPEGDDVDYATTLGACAALLPHVPGTASAEPLTALLRATAAAGEAEALAQFVLALFDTGMPELQRALHTLCVGEVLPALTRAARTSTLAAPAFRAASCAVFHALNENENDKEDKEEIAAAAGAAAALVAELADVQDLPCAQGLLAFWAWAARDPVRVRAALIGGVGTVARTGTLLAHLAVMWQALLEHAALCRMNSSNESEAWDAVENAIAHAVLALSDAALVGQDGLWCTGFATTVPHGALLALYAALAAQHDAVRTRCAQLAAFCARAAVPIAPALCESTSTALLRAHALAQDPTQDPVLDALMALLLAEWRATGDAAGVLAGTRAWLAGALLSTAATPGAVSASPLRVARAFYAHVQATLGEGAPSAVLRLAARLVAHVRAACTAYTACTTASTAKQQGGTASFDAWQALLGSVLRDGADGAAREAFARATLAVAARCAPLAADSGVHEVAAHLWLLQHDLAWELAARAPADALRALPRPAEALRAALPAFVRAGAFSAARALVPRLVCAGVLTPANAASLRRALASTSAPIHAPAAHWLLRFDGHQLPPAIDGCAFVARTAPAVPLSRLIARLRRRLGRDLVVLPASEQSPVLRPAKCVYITRAWVHSDDDGEAGDTEFDVDAAPTTTFTAFLPLVCASQNHDQKENRNKQQGRERRQSMLMRHISETAVLLKARTASVDTSGTPPETTEATTTEKDDFEEDEYILGGERGHVPAEVVAGMGPKGVRAGPVAHTEISVARALPGALVLTRVVRCACTAVPRAFACAAWAARATTRLQHLCAALRAADAASPAPGATAHALAAAAAAATRCPACAARLRSGRAAAVERSLPSRSGTSTSADALAESLGEALAGDGEMAAGVREAVQEGARGCLVNPGVALEALRTALAEALAEALADGTLLSLRAGAALVAREALRRKALRDAVEAHLRREHIRRQRAHTGKEDAKEDVKAPDWSTLRIVCPPGVSRLQKNLAQLHAVAGYALVLVDALSKHALTDLLPEHLRWEEVLAETRRDLLAAAASEDE